MAHFCWFLKYIFLLLMLSSRAPTIDTRPAPAPKPAPARQSDLIAGNEFLKLFLDHDEQQRNLHSSEYEGRGESPGTVMPLRSVNRGTSARSLEHNTHYRNPNSHVEDDGKRSVVKLVTSGSKIVFLEDYEDELTHAKLKAKTQHNSDEVKVVAVSVSSSSKRGSGGNVVSRQQRVTTTTRRPATPVRKSSAASAEADFINRSHKSELSIEETEPLTMLQHHKRSGDNMDDAGDSVNSASTNIQNVLAAPLVAADVAAVADSAHSTAATVTAYHGGSSRNATVTALRINQSMPPAHDTTTEETPTANADTMEDKLLPFQTVIYHDTKQGRGLGPQSRSISYSSLSQNVEDLHAWQRSGSILAEAQRNVSESLKPAAPRLRAASEPAKFYSVPSKMYSVPAKFYSEPAKVYSEPSKIYGQPEKVYSEPAKVYSEPSKFYSEPAKIYSQPAKVYGEPAKTYWPQTLTTSTSTSTPPPTSPPSLLAALTTVTPPATDPPTTYMPSRRPAIVSRIAFGEAQTMTTTSTTTSTPLGPATTSGTSAAGRPAPATWQHQTHHYQHLHHQQQHQSKSNHPSQRSHSHHQQSSSTPNEATNSQPRRVLFNLDKLPYDLLNAPQPQTQSQSRHLLEPILLKSPTIETATESQPITRHRQQQSRPCWEPTSSSSSLSSASALSTSQQQQQRQHSSLSVQHSNQNAKGLPNRDLVKCVSKYAHSITGAGAVSTSYSASAQRHYTTERSNFDDELYTPTPEQNYEIEESVSVMTNGRAHGVHGGLGPALAAAATTTPTTPTATALKQRNRNRYENVGGATRERGSVTFNTNANANVANDYDGDEGDGSNGNDEHTHYHNNQSHRHSQSHSHNEDDAQQEDGGGQAGGNEGEGDEDDSKVAAYVVEGRNYRKYRVEEKTDDGFIVGEYGVVDHNDGNLRGVRYTADSTINRSLIQKALLTFLKLK